MLNFFGDSTTVGVSADTTAIPYPTYVSFALDIQINNYGISGSQLADDISNIYSKPIYDSFIMSGYNDLRYYGANYTDWQNALESAVAWLGNSTKMKAQGSGMTYTGTWTNTAVYGGAIGKFSQTVGNTVSFGFTGSILYISSIRLTSAAGGTFDVNIDGTDYGTYSCTGFVDCDSGLGYSPFLVRLTGLANTTHTVTLTQNGAGTIYFDFAAVPNSGNKVVLVPCCTSNATGYALQPNIWNHGNDTIAATYHSIAASVASMFAGDGLNVVCGTSEYSPALGHIGSDNVHPNNFGYMVIAAKALNAYNSSW